MRAAFFLIPALAACGPQVTRAHIPETGTLEIEANGLNFHYFEEGEGPLVLLLHGFPDTAHTWDEVRPALAARGFRAVSPFMRGYAPTDVPDEDADDVTLGEDVLALIEALGEDSAVLVGHDWGAQAAYAATSLEPDRVEKLVTVAIPHPATLNVTPAILWNGRHFQYLNKRSAVGLMQGDDFRHVDELYARWSPQWRLPEAHLEPVKNAFALEPALNAALGYYRAARLRGELYEGEIEVPSLLVGGTSDLLPERSFTEDSRAGYSGPYRVEMLDGGHFVHNESSEAFIEILLGFLEEE